MLMERSYNIKNSNNNNNINSNNTINNIQNNINLIGFGKEEMVELLSNKEKRNILNNGLCCLEKFVEISNCGDHDKSKNLIITNLKDNYAYKYDDKLGYFIKTSKNEAIDDLMTNRVNDIEIIYEEFEQSTKINLQMKNKVKEFINKINDNQKFIDQGENKIYETYKEYKKDKIVLLLYNNQDKITKDITLLFA
jgi:hypothetical protein